VEELVAGLVAVRVVELLESIEVEQRHRAGDVVAGSSR